VESTFGQWAGRAPTWDAHTAIAPSSDGQLNDVFTFCSETRRSSGRDRSQGLLSYIKSIIAAMPVWISSKPNRHALIVGIADDTNVWMASKSDSDSAADSAKAGDFATQHGKKLGTIESMSALGEKPAGLVAMEDKQQRGTNKCTTILGMLQSLVLRREGVPDGPGSSVPS
jgi:hypothetical protein